jgi:hypothetical protein
MDATPFGVGRVVFGVPRVAPEGGATLGWYVESRWDSKRRFLKETLVESERVSIPLPG